jgi:carboxyl-terminal processing protease
VPKKIELSLAQTIIAVIVLMGGAFVGGQLAPQVVSLGASTGGHPNFLSLQDTYDTLKRKFDGPIDDTKVLDGARAGILQSTGDPYTVYLDPKAAKELDNDLNGTLSGIGAEVGIKGGKLTVIAPIADSPADKAGLKPGDIILKINNTDSSGLALDEAVGKIRGAKGTKVTLNIVRGSGQPQDITITRDVINVPSVKWSMKSNGIGYIQITEFGSDTSDKIVQAATELKNQGANKIILDLRNDPGGYLEAAVSVSSQFLPQGKLVVEERHGNVTRDKLNSDGGGLLVGMPLVVLINGGSASASEIVSGALHDQHAATLIGEKSFGKGSVQEITKLSGGAELKITVAHWYTPDGKNINKEGISPDIEVKQTQADYDASRDPQLDRAIQELSK